MLIYIFWNVQESNKFEDYKEKLASLTKAIENERRMRNEAEIQHKIYSEKIKRLEGILFRFGRACGGSFDKLFDQANTIQEKLEAELQPAIRIAETFSEAFKKEKRKLKELEDSSKSMLQQLAALKREKDEMHRSVVNLDCHNAKLETNIAEQDFEDL